MLKRLGLADKYDTQIEILLSNAPDCMKMERFAKSAEFNYLHKRKMLEEHEAGCSAAFSVWTVGGAPSSLFSSVPGFCACPVSLKLMKMIDDEDIPVDFDREWEPTRNELEAFKRVQLRSRGLIR